MLSYGKQSINRQDTVAVRTALMGDIITRGDIVEKFEALVSQKVGAKYGIATTSGTTALTIAYQATKMRRLVTTANTFVATASAAALAGMDSVDLKDIDLHTGNWRAPQVALPDTLYVPVHYGGLIADIPVGIEKQTIEDSCHSMTYTGRTIAACFSFHPLKHITTGEGGMIVTNSLAFANECRRLRDHGRKDGWVTEISGNYHMTDFQAALGISQLERLDEFLSKRRLLSLLYHNDLQNVTHIQRPPLNDQPHLYPILTDRRDQLKAFLYAHGVGTAIHYPPVYRHPAFHQENNSRWYADEWYEKELSLPLYPTLKIKDVHAISALIKEFYNA